MLDSIDNVLILSIYFLICKLAYNKICSVYQEEIIPDMHQRHMNQTDSLKWKLISILEGLCIHWMLTRKYEYPSASKNA